MGEAARSRVILLYNGVDISADVSRDLVRFEFTDNASGQVDDLQVTLQDRQGLWRGAWLPEKGASLVAVVVPAFGTGTLACGSFQIDEVQISGPPNVVTMKAVSTPVESAIRSEKHTKAWESDGLQNIAAEIAQEAGLALFYEAPAVNYDRVDQREESNLQFLQRLAEEAGLNLKISDTQVVIYDEQTLEAQASVATIDVEGGMVTRYGVRSKTRDVYRAARSRYRDGSKNETFEFLFEPEEAPQVGQVLELRRRVESLDEARNLCRRELRNKNRSEVTIDIAMVGNTLMQAGQNIDVAGIGALSAKFHVEQARHTIDSGGGYTTSITGHRVLSYS